MFLSPFIRKTILQAFALSSKSVLQLFPSSIAGNIHLVLHGLCKISLSSTTVFRQNHYYFIINKVVIIMLTFSNFFNS